MQTDTEVRHSSSVPHSKIHVGQRGGAHLHTSFPPPLHTNSREGSRRTSRHQRRRQAPPPASLISVRIYSMRILAIRRPLTAAAVAGVEPALDVENRIEIDDPAIQRRLVTAAVGQYAEKPPSRSPETGSCSAAPSRATSGSLPAATAARAAAVRDRHSNPQAGRAARRPHNWESYCSTTAPRRSSHPPPIG